MIQVSGALAMGLQSSFAENWLEAAGEILPDEEFEGGAHERELAPPGPEVALVVNSAPSEGRSTRARTLFQILGGLGAEIHLHCLAVFHPRPPAVRGAG